MFPYDENNHLKPNQSKTQLCSVQLRNQESVAHYLERWKCSEQAHLPRGVARDTWQNPVLQTHAIKPKAK